jgi:hypothetical protein
VNGIDLGPAPEKAIAKDSAGDRPREGRVTRLGLRPEKSHPPGPDAAHLETLRTHARQVPPHRGARVRGEARVRNGPGRRYYWPRLGHGVLGVPKAQTDWHREQGRLLFDGILPARFRVVDTNPFTRKFKFIVHRPLSKKLFALELVLL